MPRAALRSYPDINLYQQVDAVLRDQIGDGGLKPGDRLPVEEDLCRQFQVSRGPVRQALDALERDGLIERLPGRGTFVRAVVPRPVDERVVGPWPEIIRAGVAAATRLTRAGVCQPPRTVSRALAIPEEAEVAFFIKFSVGKSEKRVGVKRYFHPDLAGDAHRLAAAATFDEALGAITQGRRHVGSAWVEAILAEPRFAMQLKVPLGSPLVSIWWVDCVGRRPLVCTQMLQPGAAIGVGVDAKGPSDAL